MRTEYRFGDTKYFDFLILAEAEVGVFGEEEEDKDRLLLSAFPDFGRELFLILFISLTTLLLIILIGGTVLVVLRASLVVGIVVYLIGVQRSSYATAPWVELINKVLYHRQ